MNIGIILKHIHLKNGDITLTKCDAIVNAANTSLLGGGGVDGAIHKAAGPKLLEECRELGGCKPGEVKITGGYCLKAEYIIHTPGPIYCDGNSGEPDILKNSYYNSLMLAKKYKLKSISFPAISTGIYRYPKNDAAKIAIATTIDFINRENYIIDVYFIQFDSENYSIYNTILEGMKQ